jgi:hypothetical protein
VRLVRIINMDTTRMGIPQNRMLEIETKPSFADHANKKGGTGVPPLQSSHVSD